MSKTDNNTIKVSVIIPTYNSEKTINRCIDSVLCQTLKEIEVIVVNDGSTDETDSVLELYEDSRIRVITIPNSSQGLARNVGIVVARGEYIGFVDADDTVCVDMYECMYNMGSKHSADVVQCAINDIKNGVTTIRPQIDDVCVKIDDRVKYVREYFFRYLHTNELCNKIFKRQFIRENNLKIADTKKVYSEDLKFNIDILSYMNSICYIKKPLYNYYISDSGHCRKDPEKRLSQIYELYQASVADIKEPSISDCIKSMAVTTLMGYCVPIIDSDAVSRLLSDKKLKGYMLASIRYKKGLMHTALMLSLMCTPKAIKKKIISWKYASKG